MVVDNPILPPPTGLAASPKLFIIYMVLTTFLFLMDISVHTKLCQISVNKMKNIS